MGVGVWVLRVCCILLMIGILFTWNTVNHGFILAIYVFCFIVQIIADFEARTRLIITKTVQKSKSLNFYKTPKGTMHPTASVDLTQVSDDMVEVTMTTKEVSLIGLF